MDSSDSKFIPTDKIIEDESTEGVAEKDYLPSPESISPVSFGESATNAPTMDISPVDQTEQIGSYEVSTKLSNINNAISKYVEETQMTEFKAVECKFITENGSVSVELVAKQSNWEKNGALDTRDKPESSEKTGNVASTIAGIQNSPDGQTQKEVPKLEEQLDEVQLSYIPLNSLMFRDFWVLNFFFEWFFRRIDYSSLLLLVSQKKQDLQRYEVMIDSFCVINGVRNMRDRNVSL